MASPSLHLDLKEGNSEVLRDPYARLTSMSWREVRLGQFDAWPRRAGGHVATLAAILAGRYTGSHTVSISTASNTNPVEVGSDVAACQGQAKVFNGAPAAPTESALGSSKSLRNPQHCMTAPSARGRVSNLKLFDLDHQSNRRIL